MQVLRRGLLAICLFPCAALAAGTLPQPIFQLPPQYEVATNAALQAMTPANLPTGAKVFRQGFAASADGGAAFYTYSGTACSLNAGAGDNGAQVQANGGGCWNIDVYAQPIIPEIWGAVGNDSTDSTAAIQASYNFATANNVPFSMYGLTYKVTSTITIDCVHGANYSCATFNSYGSIIDGTSISGNPVFLLSCSASGSVCYHLVINGFLNVNGNSTSPVCQFGKADLSDTWDSLQARNIVCDTSNTTTSSIAIQLNHITNSSMYNIFGNGGCAGLQINKTYNVVIEEGDFNQTVSDSSCGSLEMNGNGATTGVFKTHISGISFANTTGSTGSGYGAIIGGLYQDEFHNVSFKGPNAGIHNTENNTQVVLGGSNFAATIGGSPFIDDLQGLFTEPVYRTNVAGLPSCNLANVDQMIGVYDANSPTYNGALTGGSGTYALAICNGTTFVAH